MSMSTESTALEPLAPGMLELISDSRTWTVPAVIEKLAEADAPAPPDEQPFPPLPPIIELTDEQRAALRNISKVFGVVHPSERRALTEDELQVLAGEQAQIKVLLDVLGPRKEEIAEIIRHHLDVTAELAGLAIPKPKTGRSGGVTREATPRDRKGHYLLAQPKKPFKIMVAGWKKGWEQRFVSGSPSLSQDALEDLVATGQITRQEYLGFTREIRVLDEVRVQEFSRRHPVRGLQIMRAITRRSQAGSSLYGPSK
jgi:hypothetical protein